jgi:hypothetical protein
MTRLITDNAAAAQRLVPGVAMEELRRFDAAADPVGAPLYAALLGAGAPLLEGETALHGWRVLVRECAPASQFDALVELVRSGVAVPDRLAVLAQRGHGFHGAGGRGWTALPGNIHLTVHLAPQRAIPHFETVFTALGAVAAAEAVDAVAGGTAPARIKWVNDVLLEGHKVGGVLAHSIEENR